jgi:hypothetical protein
LLKVYGEATLKLIEKLTSLQRGGDEEIRNFRGYSLTVTDNIIATYLNDINPDRRILKDKLRYFFETRQGYAGWRVGEKFICGLAVWELTGQSDDRTERIIELRNNPRLIDQRVVPHRHIDKIKPDDWANLLKAIFDYVNGPAPLDGLINIVADLLGVKDEFQQAGVRDEDDDAPVFDPAEPGPPRPLSDLMAKEFLQQLWAAICNLKPLMRAAYLLSLGNIGKKAAGLSTIEIELFPAYGVAAKSEIGRLLNISNEQFERLWDELPDMDTAARREAKTLATYEEKFAMLWNHLPLRDDKVIASLLNCKPLSIATARFRAINDYLLPTMKTLGW